MTYDQSIDYLNSLDRFGSVLGLSNMRALSRELDNPECGLKFVHVTGTNGKGSVCAFLSGILTEAGYKVGTYNSPAVVSDKDQIRINMDVISDDLFCESLELVKSACDNVVLGGGSHPTRFEVVTMMALCAFYIEGCDIVIMETGLGGKDDATNIIESTLLNIITPISDDHIGIIGNNIKEITQNKSGIIKTSAPVLMYDRSKAEMSYNSCVSVIKEKCLETGSDLYMVDESLITNLRVRNECLKFDVDTFDLTGVTVRMMGIYQPANALIAINAAEILIKMGYNISEKAILSGMEKTKIPFRFERVRMQDKVDIMGSAANSKEWTGGNNAVDIILDGAHNPDGVKSLVKSLLLNFPDREFIYVTGIFKDKDYKRMAEISAHMAKKIFVVQNEKSERSLDKNILAREFSKYCDDTVISESIASAVKDAAELSKNTISANNTHPVVVCFGSLSWLNEAKESIKTYNSKNNTFGGFQVDTEKIKEGTRLILQGIGEDLNREGLKDTPDRVARMCEEIFAGMNQTADVHLQKTFPMTGSEMIIEKDITFYSVCEHHLMPFYGKAHIAYIPDGRVVGISKLARCVETYAKKPQIQENLTEEIADALMQYLKPKGVIVMLEAEHMCMSMRGVKKPGTKTVTMALRGKMKKKANRELFFKLLNKKD